jgi:hypothetical protein
MKGITPQTGDIKILAIGPGIKRAEYEPILNPQSIIF